MHVQSAAPLARSSYVDNRSQSWEISGYFSFMCVLCKADHVLHRLVD